MTTEEREQKSEAGDQRRARALHGEARRRRGGRRDPGAGRLHLARRGRLRARSTRCSRSRTSTRRP
jgi:hypothetical protein